MLDLAHRNDFEIGPLTVRPSSRELVGTAGTVMVEPKVMQVLVALADAGGRVVARDELTEKCWAGKVVGEDAINRVIGKLRRTAAATGGAFRIETVARAGHRLVSDAPAAGLNATSVPPDAPPQSRGPWRRAAAVALSVAVIGGIAATYPEASRPGLSPGSLRMPAAVTDLETRGLSLMFENRPEQTVEAVAYLRQATALAPRSAPVWGSLAMSYVLQLGWAPPAERAGLAMRVREAAGRGLALDPRESRSAAALISLDPTFGHWSAKAAALASARARSHPDIGPLAFQQVQFLVATGRVRAALAAIRPLVAGSPLVPWIQAAYIDLLAANGDFAAAERAADAAARIWPRERLIWFTRFDLALFNGQADRALAMAADRAMWPKQATTAEIELAARTARVLASATGAGRDALLDRLVASAGASHAEAERAIQVAAAFGRTDVALGVARRLYLGRLPAAPRRTMLPTIGMPGDGDPPTAALFIGPAAALTSDPGFLALADKMGLVAYWRITGAPDFCATPAAHARCLAAGLRQ